MLTVKKYIYYRRI